MTGVSEKINQEFPDLFFIYLNLFVLKVDKILVMGYGMR